MAEQINLLTKDALDRRVASLLGKRAREVSVITEALIHEIVRALVEGSEVRLDGLGVIRIVRRESLVPTVTVLTRGHGHKNGRKGKTVLKVHAKYYVCMQKGTRLREALKQHRRSTIMDKYAVDENTDGEKLEKQATDGCPLCGKKPERHGNVLMCPVHGSEPFEAAPSK